MRSTLEVLKAVRKRLGVPERWAKEASARDGDGGAVHPASPSAACWCLRGAVEAETQDCGAAWAPVMEALGQAIARKGYGHHIGLTSWQDASWRKHAEVLAVVDDAIEHAAAAPA